MTDKFTEGAAEVERAPLRKQPALTQIKPWETTVTAVLDLTTALPSPAATERS